MKRILFSILLLAGLSVRSLAADENIPAAVLVAFHNHFANAASISYAQVDELTRISFMRDGKQYCAYYDADARLTILSHQVSPDELPQALREDLNKRFSDYSLADLYLFEKDGKRTWYAALNGHKIRIVLSAEKSSWKEFSAAPQS